MSEVVEGSQGAGKVVPASTPNVVKGSKNRWDDRRLRVGALLLLLLAAVLGVVILMRSNTVSDEMINLRRVEASLSLPGYEERTEDDRGIYLDEDGREQRSRNIGLVYDGDKALDSVRESIDGDDKWDGYSRYSLYGESKFDYINLDSEVCLTISSRDSKSYLAIKGETEKDCGGLLELGRSGDES